MNSAESHQEAVVWQKKWSADRHCRLFKRIGREKWLKTYHCKEFITFIGKENWRELTANMKEIFDNEG